MRKAALERPRPIIYDNDGDDFSYHRGMLSVEALLAKNDKETVDNIRDITANINSKL